MEEKRETTGETRESHEGILEYLGKLIPLGILFTAFIGFGIAYMSFIGNNGYTHQMNSVEKNGIEHFMDNFTDGNVAMMTEGPVVTIINGLAVLQIIVLLITYCKYDFKKNMVLSVVSFIAIGVVTVVSMVYWGTVKGYLVIPESVQVNIARVMAENTNLSIALALGAILILTLFAVKILKIEYKRMLIYGVGALIIGRCLLPVLLLVLENGVSILAALAGVVALVIAVIFIGILMKPGEGSSGSNTYSYQEEKRGSEEKLYSENRKKETEENGDVWKINRDAILWVEENLSGGKEVIPYAGSKYNEKITYNLFYNVMLSDFLSGKVKIYIKGKRMTEKDLHYGKRPK